MTPQPILSVTTSHPCPRCGVAIGVIHHPDAEHLHDFIKDAHSQYPGALPDGPEEWAGGYDRPAYVYCDSVICDYHAVAEWSDVRGLLPKWRDDGAPSWRELVEAGGGEA